MKHAPESHIPPYRFPTEPPPAGEITARLTARMAWWWKPWWSGLLFWALTLGLPVNWGFVERVNVKAVRVEVKP